MSELDPQAGPPFEMAPEQGHLPTPAPVAPPPPPPPPPPLAAGPFQPAAAPARTFGKALVAGLAAAIVFATAGGVGIGWGLARAISGRSSTTAPIHTVNPSTNGGSAGTSAASRVIPAVVDINTTIETSTSTGEAAGTGLILDSMGDVLTNNHVVEGAVSIRVTIQGRSGTYTAIVVGVDPPADLAVIRIQNVSSLPTVTMADSSSLHIGDSILAIGNALGLGGTPRVTQGSITALDQQITASENGSQSETLTGMIQADAEISPGDSGGAIVNSAGQVVGIITAGQATSFRTTTSSVDYAIPSSTAVSVANEILAGHETGGILIGPRGFLGVSVESLNSDIAAQLGLNVNQGALVRTVRAGSPAEQAGITSGSVITVVGGTTIDSADKLGTALHKFRPGDQVRITWVDPSGSHSATVTLISGPAV